MDWNFPNYEEKFRLSLLIVVDAYVSPLQFKKTKLHTIYAVHFTTCTLTGKERKVSGLRRVSNILKRTLEYLAIHNEMKLAHLGMLVHFGQQNGDTANKQTVC